MCLIDSSTCKLEEDSNALLSSNLNNESNNVIQSSEFNYKFKFKIRSISESLFATTRNLNKFSSRLFDIEREYENELKVK